MNVWFILFEGGDKSNHILADLYITVGILMNAIVARITKFYNNDLGDEEYEKKETHAKQKGQ